MLSAGRAERLLPYALLGIFFCAMISTRPLLPVDETRYLTVAWEMYLRQSFLVPTLNFEPYFQKPPLLFWLIDLAWTAFGVSRLAAISVIFLVSSLVIFLTSRLAAALFPEQPELHRRMPWLIVGSVAFVIYSTLILFDLLLTACILGFFLSLIAFADSGRMRFAMLAGVCIGLGLLAKGPVLFIHIAFPILLSPLWRRHGSAVSMRGFAKGVALAIAIGLAIALAWLGPALLSTGKDFAYGLLWEQSAGRIAGSTQGAHARPFYFYLLLSPLLLLPWGLSPGLWAKRPRLLVGDHSDVGKQDRRTLGFLAIWCIGDLVVFSLISGKQPHYLVPILPPLMLALGFFMSEIRVTVIAATAACMVGLFAFGQVLAMGQVLYRYDLAPAARFIAKHRDADLAYVGRYQGELTFLARIMRPLEIVAPPQAEEWLRAHPEGFLVMKAPHFPDDTKNVAYSQIDQRGYLLVLNGHATEGLSSK